MEPIFVCLEENFKSKNNENDLFLPFLLRVRGVVGCSSVASARLGQSFGYKKDKIHEKEFKMYIIQVNQLNQVVYPLYYYSKRIVAKLYNCLNLI
jgi:hypothetical protein